MGEAKTLYVALAANVTGYVTPITRAAAVTDRFGRRLDGLEKSGGRVGNVLATAAKLGVLVLATALVAAVGSAAQFETRMRNVNSIVKMSEADLAATGDAVVDLSRRLPQSANNLADGLYDIASSGFQGAAGLTVLEAAAVAASAGMSTTATSSKAITAVLNAYGRGAKDAADVSDVLFQGVNLGVMTFDELASSVGDFVGTGAAAKLSIEQLVAAQATMTLSGISAAESGTSLNRVIQSIIDPSEELAATLKDLGYESGAQALETDGLRGVMDRLRGATGGQVEQLLKLFPEIRAARGALALMSAEGANYAKVSAEIEDRDRRQGATTAALAEQSKSLSFQWARFRNNANAVAIDLGTRMIPALGRLLDGVQDVGAFLGPILVEAFRRARPIIEDVTDAWGDQVRTLGNLWDVAQPFVRVLASLAGLGLYAVLRGWAEALQLIYGVLADTTGFLADNKAAVAALATVIVGALLPGLIATARVAFWNLFSTGLVALINGTAAAVGGLATGLTFLASAQGMATLGAGALVAMFVVVAQGADKAEAKARRLVDTLNRDVKSTSVRSYGDAIAATQAELDKALRKNQSYFDGVDDWFRSTAELFTPMDNGMQDSAAAVDALRKNLAELQLAQDNVVANTAGAAMELFGMSDAAYHAGRATGDLNAVVRLAERHNIDLSGSYDVVVPKLRAAWKEHLAGTDATRAHAKVTDVFSDKTASAADKVDALKASLDALIGVHVNATQAEIGFEKAIDDLTETVAKNGRTLDVRSEKGRANMSAVLDVIDATVKHTEALAAEGKSVEEVNRAFNEHVRQFVAVARAAGLTDRQIAELQRKYGMVPRQVITTVTADTSQAERALAGLRRPILTTIVVDGVTFKNISPQLGRTLREQGIAFDTGGIVEASKANTLYKWAEPSTGGEAFIPLGQAHRPRSVRILDDVAGRFGYDVVARAGGGVHVPGSMVPARPRGGTPLHVTLTAPPTRPAIENLNVTVSDRATAAEVVDEVWWAARTRKVPV